MWSVQWLQAHAVVAALAGAFGAAIGAALRYLPRIVLELVAVRTRDPETRAACLEAIRLRRADAASLPSYLTAHPSASPPSSSDESVADTRARP